VFTYSIDRGIEPALPEFPRLRSGPERPLDAFIGRYGAEILFGAELPDDPGNLSPDKLRSAEYSTTNDYLLRVNLDTIDTCVGYLSHLRGLVERVLFRSR
jgi:hypothetical protein